MIKYIVARYRMVIALIAVILYKMLLDYIESELIEFILYVIVFIVLLILYRIFKRSYDAYLKKKLGREDVIKYLSNILKRNNVDLSGEVLSDIKRAYARQIDIIINENKTSHEFLEDVSEMLKNKNNSGLIIKSIRREKKLIFIFKIISYIWLTFICFGLIAYAYDLFIKHL